MIQRKFTVLLLRLVHKRKRHSLINFLGKKILLCPGVFDPRTITTKFFIKNMQINHKSKVLDMGTGTGIIAIFAAEKAKKVVAADKSDAAINCAKQNAKINSICNITFVKSDLFEKIKEKFDIILFQPPYIKGKAKKEIDKTFIENNTVKRFLQDARKYLRRKGYIIMSYSTLGEPEKMLKQARKYYKVELIAKKRFLFEKIFLFKLTPLSSLS